MKDFILNILAGILCLIVFAVLVSIGIALVFTTPGHIVLVSVVGIGALWFIGGLWRGKIELESSDTRVYPDYDDWY